MLPRPLPRRALAVAILPLLAGCAFHSTATRWNGHVGADGQRVFVQTSTYWGAHFCIALPWFGNTTVDKMIDVATARIRPEDGSRLRIVETEVYNGWAAIPPLTWLFTPMMTSVSIEYVPTAQALASSGQR